VVPWRDGDASDGDEFEDVLGALDQGGVRPAEQPRRIVRERRGGREHRALKSIFRPRPRVAADTIVQSLSGDADALLDCYNEKGLQMQAFSRAAEGIRTLDLLHGKQSVSFPFGADIPCKCIRSRVWLSLRDSPAFTAKSRGFGHRMGTRPRARLLLSDAQWEDGPPYDAETNRLFVASAANRATALALDSVQGRRPLSRGGRPSASDATVSGLKSDSPRRSDRW
jgi:hypothetical protein